MFVDTVQSVFDRAMKTFGFPNGENIAVGVSGGADSTALCLLTKDFVNRYGGRFLALIVDHGLRSVSRQQALLTAQRLDALGIKCRILTWQGEKPQHGIEEKARKERYRLLSEACHEEGCSSLLLGHHRQDQAETFLIRQSKKSGIAGLAGMSAVRPSSFGRILRPLLGVYPADLRAYNRYYGQDWVEDETNLSSDFERGRLRRILTPEQIERAFQQTLLYGAKRRQLEEKASAFIKQYVIKSEQGYMLFPKESFKELDKETALFCLGDFLRYIANRDYPPRTDSLELVWKKICMNDFHGLTLGGCQLAETTKRYILIWREMNDLPEPLTVVNSKRFEWDRFSFLLESPLAFPIRVEPLNHRLKLKKVYPKRVFSVLPALFDNEGLFIVPHLGYKRTKTTCRVMFSPRSTLCETAQWTCPVI